MFVIGALNLIIIVACFVGGYLYGYNKGVLAGAEAEAAKYVDKVKVVKKETVA